MVTFNNDDEAYLQWVDKHPLGYVINAPKQHTGYPNMLHRASCASVTTRQRTNYTTTDYMKLCSLDRQELVTWGESSPHGLALCKHCKP